MLMVKIVFSKNYKQMDFANIPYIILLLVVIFTLFGLIDVDAAWNIFCCYETSNFLL